MSDTIIKELFGFSGNKIFLVKTDTGLIVRKIGNVGRNIERLLSLSSKLPLPKLYTYTDTSLDCEYIHSLDMKTYLLTHNVDDLVNFLITIFEVLSKNSKIKDYSQVYIDKLSQIDWSDQIIFSKTQLFENLPTHLPSSDYFGDLTLENILYSKSQGFVLIDCQTVEYDSYIFDILKLRQDLECKWFLRNDTDVFLDVKLQLLQSEILKKFPMADSDYLLILMMLRIYKYAKPGTFEYEFIISCINSIWETACHKYYMRTNDAQCKKT